MPLRVLHVTPYCEEAWGYGGIPRVVGGLTRELARRGHHVTVMATDARDAVSRLRAGSSSAGDVETLLYPNLSNRLAYRHQLFLPRGLAAALRERVRSFDVAHLHGCRNLPGTLAARELDRAGIPWVLTPNGTAPRIERNRFAKLVYDLVVDRRTLPRAARVLAVSDVERRQLLALGVDDARIRLVPNPVDLGELARRPERGTFRARHGLGQRPIVAYLGKLTPRKRVDLLVDAFSQLNVPDAKLVIAGNDMGVEPALHAQAKRAGIDVLFAGLVTGPERFAVLADADVVVYPSQDEIFGLVPLEALSCETPALVSDDSGAGEILARVGAGDWVLPLGDVAALISLIRAILGEPDSARARARSAAERVAELYSPVKVVDTLESVYRQVAGA